MGTTLTQNGYPVFCFSKKFLKNYKIPQPTCVKYMQLLKLYKSDAVISSVNSLSLKLTKNIKGINESDYSTPAQYYYVSKLLDYDYVILYKPGKSNTVVDAL